MISPDPAKNYLSEAQSREIFDKHIRPLFVAGARPWQAGDRSPTAIILTGQTGSGKSTIARRIQGEWAADRGAPVMFDVDALRPFHPDYLEAKQQSWEMEDVVTLGDARRWYEALFDASREAGMEMFPESGLREGRFESYIERLASPAGADPTLPGRNRHSGCLTGREPTRNARSLQRGSDTNRLRPLSRRRRTRCPAGWIDRDR